MTKILVCGGREFDDWAVLCGWLDQAQEHYGHVEIIEGEAKGADFLARVWAKYRGVPCHRFPVDWTKHKRAAGPIRNQQMLDEGQPDVVMAFPGDTGTEDMISKVLDAGVQVFRFDKAPGQ